MEENKLIKQTEQTFESIKHIDENGVEFWYARELMITLEYTKWGNFKSVIIKAIQSCENSNINAFDHFAEVGKTVPMPSGARPKIIEDFKLTRYACYLIAQNGSPTKKQVALAQTYFAVQTRKQEITEEEYKKLPEDERRKYNRKIVKDRNTILYAAAQEAGVTNYGKFTNYGYKGLYNGETENDIHRRKGLKEKESILDYMGSEELGANIFRITQTEAKLRNDKVNNEDDACITHYTVGKTVRKAIEELGGTMPENLPTPEKSIQQLGKEEREEKRKLKALNKLAPKKKLKK